VVLAEFLPSCLDRNAVEVFCVEILAAAEGAWNAGKSRAYIYSGQMSRQNTDFQFFDVTLSTARKIFQVFLAKSWAAEKWSTRAPSQNA
jgi:hypothetical protein